MLGLLASALLFVLSSAEEDVSGGDLLDQWLAEVKKMIERDENMKEGIDKAIEYQKEMEFFTTEFFTPEFFTTDYFILAAVKSSGVSPGYHSCPIYLPISYTFDNSGRLLSKVAYNCSAFYELSARLRKTGARQVYIEEGEFKGWYVRAEIFIKTGDI